MPHVFIVLGARNARKSSTIRVLTGAQKRGIKDVMLSNSEIIRIFVQLSSLQESKTQPDNFISEMRDKNPENILVPLWIDAGNGCPDGMTYIRAFIQAGWSISQALILGVDQHHDLERSLAGSSIHYVPNSSHMPSNQIGAQVRNWWDWM